MKKWKVVASYVLVALVASLVTLSVAVVPMLLDRVQGQSKLTQLENLILNKFIGEKDKTAIEDAASDAMIGALGDRWSYYIPAKEYQQFLESKNNAYVGIGVTIIAGEEGSEIVQVTSSGAAEKAGLRAGDVIVAVDGKDARGLSNNEMKALIQGEAGTPVSVTVRRDGGEVTKEVIRETIRTPVVAADMLEGNVGLVRIVNFNENCAQETIDAIQALVEQGAVGLVFDVRNNPGGYARELVKVLDYLLPEGPLFRTVDYAGKEEVDSSDAACLELPMAVLVNGNSYSAAEFFAAALSEYEAAVVLGEKTSGKGYFQYTYTLSDGSAVGLSVGKYFTPKGESLAGVGITPDVVVPVDQQTASDIYYGKLEPNEDPQILAALEKLKEFS